MVTREEHRRIAFARSTWALKKARQHGECAVVYIELNNGAELFTRAVISHARAAASWYRRHRAALERHRALGPPRRARAAASGGGAL